MRLMCVLLLLLVGCGSDDAKVVKDTSGINDLIAADLEYDSGLADLADDGASLPADSGSVDNGQQDSAPDDTGGGDNSAPGDSLFPPQSKELATVQIHNSEGFMRVDEPVSRGVPLKREYGVTSVDELFLLDEEGQVVPAGFTVLARWGGAPADQGAPLKWVLVDHLVSVGALQERTFTLATGDLQRPEPTVSVEDGYGIMVDTGVCQFVAGSAEYGPFPAATCDDGVMFAPPNMADMVLTLPNGATKKLSDFPPTEAPSVYRQTDTSVMVKVSGSLGQGDGGKVPLTYTAYLTFFGDSSRVRMYFRLENRNKAVHPGNIWLLGNSGSIFFIDFSLYVPLGTGPVDWALQEGGLDWFDGEAAESMKLYQDSSGGPNWKSVNHVNHGNNVKVTFKGYKRYVNGQEVGSGNRADGALLVQSGDLVMGTAFRHFWQNFPKALGYENDAMRLALWPTEFDDQHELQGGEFKTHEMWFVFGSGDGADDDVRLALKGIHRPLNARSPAQYNCETGAFLHDLGPRTAGIDDLWETTVNACVVKTGSNQRTLISQRDAIDEWGWRNFGEIFADHETNCGNQSYNGPVSHYNNQYDGISVGMFHHARIEDMPVWYWFGEELARHFFDIDVYHTSLDAEVYNGGIFPHTTHDAPAGRSTHRTFPELNLSQPCTGYTSGGPGMDYIHLDGPLLYYYMSGYPYALDVLKEVVDWNVLRMNKNIAGTVGSFRQYANCIRTMTHGYRLFHDPLYLDEAHKLLEYAADSADAFDGQTWAGAMVGKALGRYIDFVDEYGFADEYRQMALDALVSFSDETLEKYTSANVQTYRFVEMLLYAYKHSAPDNLNKEAYKIKAFQSHESAVENNWAAGTYSTAKEMVILATQGNLYHYYKALE
jgi:hypothetical protein